MSCDQALDKLSEKLNSRLLVQKEHGFQKGSTMCPLAAGAQKKPGLDKVNSALLWNSLPSSIQSIERSTAFKSALEKFWVKKKYDVSDDIVV